MILVPRCSAELDSDAGIDIIRTHEVSFACIVCFNLSSEIIHRSRSTSSSKTTAHGVE
jgi:hypothetical protein